MPLYIQPTDLPTYAPMVTVDATEQAGLCQTATNIAIGYLNWDVLSQPYTETVMVNPRNECKLTYAPVTVITSAKGRYPVTAAYLFEPILMWGQPQWEVLTATLDYLNASTGILWLPAGIYGTAFDEAMITYTAGFATVPELVKQACGMIVASLWQRRDYAGVKEMKDFDSSVAYFKNSVIPPEAMDMLNHYRLVGFA